jgi:membrane protease YdiL (CAAX protease family)
MFGSHLIALTSVLPGVFLLLSLAVCDLTKRFIGLTVFSVAIILAVYFQHVDIGGVLAIVLFGLMCHLYSHSKTGSANTLLGIGILLFASALMLHLVPGFNNPILIDGVAVSPAAPLYTQYLNFDKAVVGFFILIFIVSSPPKLSYEAVLTAVFLCSLAFGTAILLGLLSGKIAYDLKFPDYYLQWALVNLLITCYAEEAFFRGFIQPRIYQGLKHHKWGVGITIILSALLFALVHIPAGTVYVIVAFVLGLAYAYSYHKTQNILVPILAHFIFNIIHFTIFTYPYVAEV